MPVERSIWYGCIESSRSGEGGGCGCKGMGSSYKASCKQKKSVSFFRAIRYSVALYPLYFAEYWMASNVVQHFSSHAHGKDDES